MSSCVQWDCSESNGSFYCPPHKCAHYTWAKAWSTQSNLLYRYLLWQFESMDINVMKHKINGYTIYMKSGKTWYFLQFIMNIKNTVIFYLVGREFIHMVIVFFRDAYGDCWCTLPSHTYAVYFFLLTFLLLPYCWH
jgi:hypothetical protein